MLLGWTDEPLETPGGNYTHIFTKDNTNHLTQKNRTWFSDLAKATHITYHTSDSNHIIPQSICIAHILTTVPLHLWVSENCDFHQGQIKGMPYETTTANEKLHASPTAIGLRYSRFHQIDWQPQHRIYTLLASYSIRIQ